MLGDKGLRAFKMQRFSPWLWILSTFSLDAASHRVLAFVNSIALPRSTVDRVLSASKRQFPRRFSAPLLPRFSSTVGSNYHGTKLWCFRHVFTFGSCLFPPFHPFSNLHLTRHRVSSNVLLPRLTETRRITVSRSFTFRWFSDFNFTERKAERSVLWH